MVLLQSKSDITEWRTRLKAGLTSTAVGTTKKIEWRGSHQAAVASVHPRLSYSLNSNQSCLSKPSEGLYQHMGMGTLGFIHQQYKQNCQDLELVQVSQRWHRF